MAIKRGKAMPFTYKRQIARLKGEAAFLTGKMLSDNPFKLGKLRDEWRDAYTTASQTPKSASETTG